MIFVSDSVKIWALGLVLGLMFIGLVLWGQASGKARAQSNLVLQQTQSLKAAVESFYSDNNRYPSADEFADAQIMGAYVSALPQGGASNRCPQVFNYKRPALNSYELDFCLAAASNNYPAGWNKLTNSK